MFNEYIWLYYRILFTFDSERITKKVPYNFIFDSYDIHDNFINDCDTIVIYEAGFKGDKMTPLKAIRAKCLNCTGGEYKSVRKCEIEDCVLYNFRLGTGRPKLKIIRMYCLDCCNGQKAEVKACTVKRCSLYPYRLGKRPLKGVSTQKTMPAEAVLEINSDNMTKCIDWNIYL
ncbi:MAG: hypothetical protein HQK91_12740 [Nitrospirae bacterium]|nr:hypothetical protein [Nitrospirota bacterium]